MATGEVKRFHICGIKRLDTFCFYLKKSILSALKFIAIIVRNLKFDAKVHFT